MGNQHSNHNNNNNNHPLKAHAAPLLAQLNTITSQTIAAPTTPSPTQSQLAQYQDTYQKAKTDYLEGPQKLGDAAFHLIELEKGDSAYNNSMQEYLNQRVGEMDKIITAQFVQSMQGLIQLTQVYETTYKNAQHSIDLFYEYAKKNQHLKTKIENNQSLVNRNNRKSFYEDDKLITMKTWYSTLSWVYFMLLIVYCIFLLFFTQISMKYKGILIAFFFTFPYFIPTVYIPFFLGCLSVLHGIYEYFIPKNIYTGMILENTRQISKDVIDPSLP